MEDHYFEWLLSTLHDKKASIRILETGICRGDKLKAWYSNDESGKIIEKSAKNLNTRFMLTNFLNMRAPILYEYEPDKVIVYLYHTRGRKVLTARDIVDLSKNQLHGLQVRSIHMALLETYSRNILKVKVWQESGELRSEIIIGKFYKEGGRPVKDMAIIEKTEAFTIFIAEFIYSVANELIQKLQYDLEIDGSGHVYLIRVNMMEYVKQSFKKETVIMPIFEMPRQSQRKVTLRHTESVSDDEEDDKIGMNLMPIPSYKSFKKQKEAAKLKLDLNHPQKEHSPLFIDMMAKTFEKIRLNGIIKEKIDIKRKLLEKNQAYKVPALDLNFIKKIRKETKKIKTLKDLINTLGAERLEKKTKEFEEINELHEINIDHQFTFSPFPSSKIATPKPLSNLELTTALASHAYLTERMNSLQDPISPPNLYKKGLNTSRLLQLYIEEKDTFYSHKYSNTPFQRGSSFSRSSKRIKLNSPLTARQARRNFDI